jgi:hypothetical protein
MPLIALDFDDVLMGTNATVARCWSLSGRNFTRHLIQLLFTLGHNETYQTNPPMTLSEFYYVGYLLSAQ